jgi:hypothetical protein
MLNRIALCLLASSLAACGGGTALREPDEYVGCATDENWATFDDVADTVSDSQAPQLLTPTSTALPNTPVDFTWHASAAIDGTAMGDVASTCEQWNTGFTTLHEPPVSGTVYDIQISIGGDIKHRVITSLQKWTASADAWSQLAGNPISVKIRRMQILNNDRKDGPYVATTPFSATIAAK